MPETVFTAGDREQLNHIASTVANIEGQFKQYLTDQRERCSAHDRNIIAMNIRIDSVERGLTEAISAKCETARLARAGMESRVSATEDAVLVIQATTVTDKSMKSFMWKALSVTVGALVVLFSSAIKVYEMWLDHHSGVGP